jgi:hypothetical protein
MNSQLQLIVKTSGLEITKAQYILDKFTNYFEIASEWETKAKSIVVKDENDRINMELARTGRLFLREKRIAIEKARVELKEDVLRQGKAIDGIANILKGLIVPIEDYLESQEKFVEIRLKAEEAQKQADEAARLETERLAQEEANRIEQERIRQENIKLRQEAEIREKKIAEEKAKYEETIKVQEAKVSKLLEQQVECPFCHQKFTLPKV